MPPHEPNASRAREYSPSLRIAMHPRGEAFRLVEAIARERSRASPERWRTSHAYNVVHWRNLVMLFAYTQLAMSQPAISRRIGRDASTVSYSLYRTRQRLMDNPATRADAQWLWNEASSRWESSRLPAPASQDPGQNVAGSRP